MFTGFHSLMKFNSKCCTRGGGGGSELNYTDFM